MSTTETVYEALTNEQGARLCKDIPDSACREEPRSFTLILLSNALTQLGDALASPKTTLAWLTALVGAPALILGLIVPVRESGSMIPQIFVGAVIRRLPVRKWVWVAGSVGQALCVLGLALVAFLLRGVAAGWAILALVVVFSLCRGFCSVAAKDVLGKTVPKERRGRLAGWSSSAAGLLSVAIGLSLLLPITGQPGKVLLGLLLLLAAVLWLVAAAVYARIPEFAGETDGGRGIRDALGTFSLLYRDVPFRRFVLTRALMTCSALSAPFYIALAQQSLGTGAAVLGAFIVAAGLASLVSGPFWGRFADVSSRAVMRNGALITALVGGLTLILNRCMEAVAHSVWFLPLAYFVLSVAHNGVRVGRKTYVVNLASGNRRTDYVAISNTVIGVLLLFIGSVGALAPAIGSDGVIGLLALMGLAGAALATTLPE